ncbi:MAG: exodeoxyribonuclease VII small subunit [Verrucomicrobiota bacterium]
MLRATPTPAVAAVEEPEVDFESAIGRLEELVAQMENEPLKLDALVQHYEEGSKLLAECEGKLDRARQRIQEIEAESAAQPGGSEPAPTKEKLDGGDEEGDELF